MVCIKCGKKTTDNESFCPACLEVMEIYPVNPEVHVQLPLRPAVANTKKSARKKKPLSEQEIIASLQKRVRGLVATLLLMTLFLGTAVFLLVKDWPAEEEIPIGQNYSSNQTTD